MQKLYKSRQVRAFNGDDLKAATETLGYYSDLQSVHSEDALIWSVFGTIAYMDTSVRRNYCMSLFKLLDLPYSEVKQADIWLWRRIPHPDTLCPGGPEIDFGIHADDVVIFGEAKWFSKVARQQGKKGNKDQLVLRREFIQNYGNKFHPDVKNFGLVCVSYDGGLQCNKDVDLGFGWLRLRDVKWEAVCNLNTHPL
ncbi:MAG: hypothetical protein IT210_23060 [Armatimonadetes bacterium]|nr:hypothetical protein [Armatimonadota bacterium]